MFDARFFSKENTRNRLMRRTAELWAIDESELINFDPLIRLLLEAVSVEIEKVAREIQGSEVRLIERMAEVLCPGAINRPQPAWAIAQATPLEPRSRVEPETVLVLRKTNPAKGEAGEVFFSPACPLPLVRAQLSMIASPLALYELDKGGRTLLAEAKKGVMGGEKWIWFGFEAKSSLDTWDGFRFFFDWRGDAFKELYTSLLRLARWRTSKGPVRGMVGYGDGVGSYSKSREAMLHLFAKQFVTLSEAEKGGKKAPELESVPEEVVKLFGALATKVIRPMYWIRMDLPSSFPAEGFESLTVSFNAFPVINRRIHKFTYRLQPGLNGIPLTSDEVFFDVHSIINQQEERFVESEHLLNDPIDRGAGFYSIRQQGMGRFDQRDAKNILYHLLELLRDEQMAFSALGEEYLASLLREMAQNMARLDQKLGAKRSVQIASQPFLVVRAGDRDDSIFVSYWTTLGEAANGLPAGSKLVPYSSSFLNSNEIFLLTKPTGGRGALSSSEYVQELRKNVQSRGRLVTREDIRVFCQAELGKRARRVEIKQHYMSGHLPSQGFVRCIQIRIEFDKSGLEVDECQAMLDGLQARIELQTSQALPVQVVLD